jgi:hypothetical protein
MRLSSFWSISLWPQHIQVQQCIIDKDLKGNDRNLIHKLSQIFAGDTEWNHGNLWETTAAVWPRLELSTSWSWVYSASALRYSVVSVADVLPRWWRLRVAVVTGAIYLAICMYYLRNEVMRRYNFPSERKRCSSLAKGGKLCLISWQRVVRHAEVSRCCDVIVYPLLHCVGTMARGFYRVTRCISYVTPHKFPQPKACRLCAAFLALIRAGFNFWIHYSRTLVRGMRREALAALAIKRNAS